MEEMQIFTTFQGNPATESCRWLRILWPRKYYPAHQRCLCVGRCVASSAVRPKAGSQGWAGGCDIAWKGQRSLIQTWCWTGRSPGWSWGAARKDSGMHLAPSSPPLLLKGNVSITMKPQLKITLGNIQCFICKCQRLMSCR